MRRVTTSEILIEEEDMYVKIRTVDGAIEFVGTGDGDRGEVALVTLYRLKRYHNFLGKALQEIEEKLNPGPFVTFRTGWEPQE